MTEALPVGLFLATLKCAAALGNAILAWAIASRSSFIAGKTTEPVVLVALGLPVLGSIAIAAMSAKTHLFGLASDERSKDG